MGECMELYTPGAALFSILVPSTDFLFSKKSSQDGSDLSLWSGQIRCLV